MKGLDRIIEMRRRGMSPITVTLFPLTPSPVDFPTWIHWEPTDVPELTDLRALIGLFVSVTGSDEMAKRWAKAAMKAEASSVVILDGKEMQVLRLGGVDQ